jgi:hypothetical protein
MKPKDRKKRTCRGCGEHQAIFVVNGKVRADADHDLCPRCFWAEINRLRSGQLPEAA